MEAERTRKAEEEAAEFERLRKEAEEAEAAAKEEKQKRDAAMRQEQEGKLVAIEALLKEVAQEADTKLIQLEREQVEERLKSLGSANVSKSTDDGEKTPSKKAVSFEVSEGDGEAEVGDKVPQADEEEEEEDEEEAMGARRDSSPL